MAPHLYLDTQYARPEWQLTKREGLWGWVRTEDPQDPQSGLSATAFWLTLDELYRLLSESGYTTVEILARLPDDRHGPRVHIAANRLWPPVPFARGSKTNSLALGMYRRILRP